MLILVGHERSGVIRDRLRRLGHEAWSCDLEDVQPGGEFPQFHLYGDVERYLEWKPWDAGLFFPDCTYLTVSGAWAFGDGPYHQKVKPGTLVGAARREAREIAVAHVRRILRSEIPKISVENPAKNFLSRAIGPPTQIIHPSWFGDDASKQTGLWLKKLPRLRQTGWVEPRTGGLPLFGGDGGLPRWANQTDSGQNRLSPSEDRAMQRARTYDGIGDAMTLQWFGAA